MCGGKRRPTPIATPPHPLKLIKFPAYIIAAILLQTLIIVAIVLIFVRIKTPKVRLQSPTVERLTSNSTNSPSFSIRLTAEVTVKNSNFGHFKFPESTISILYRGNAIGSAVIPAGRAKARSTKRLNVTVAADSKNDRLLGGDLNSGKITLSSHATLNGKIHLVTKRKKTATMNCTVDVNARTNAVENLQCK